MINASNTIFDIRPEALNRVGVSVANHIDFERMGNIAMLVAHRGQNVVGSHFIGVNARTFEDLIFNNRHNRGAAHIGNDSRIDLAIALSNAKHRNFVICSASALALANAAEITFVKFNIAIKRGMIFAKAMANFFAHAPRRFISNARFALDLLGRYAAARLRHEINHIEPERQWGAGLLKDSACHRRNLVSAIVARVGFAFCYLVEQRVLFALRAINPLRIFLLANVIKARVIVRENLLKVLDRKFLHLAFAHGYLPL